MEERRHDWPEGAQEELSLPSLDQIRGGTCSADLVRELKAALEVTDVELAGLVGIPRQTMLRRFRSGMLKRHEADRVVAVARAYNAALDFFDNDHTSAVKWMKSPQYGLDWERPLEHADTVTGANEVVVLLHQMAHGIPTHLNTRPLIHFAEYDEEETTDER